MYTSFTLPYHTHAINPTHSSRRQKIESRITNYAVYYPNPHRTDSPYNDILEHYKTIDKATFYVTTNDKESLKASEIDELLFAMLKHKPIVLFDMPSFPQAIDLFAKDLIMQRLNKMIICDMTLLDDGDLKNFINNISSGPVNYVLTKHEKILINARLRNTFRSLL